MRVKHAHPHGTQVVPAISQEPWEPGEVREVDDEIGASLVESGDYLDLDAPIDTEDEPEHVEPEHEES